MILRSKSGAQTAALPNRWASSDGQVHSYSADLKTLQIKFVDVAHYVSSVEEFVKIGD